MPVNASHLLSKGARAAKVGKVGARELCGHKAESLYCGGDQAVEIRRHALGGKLVEQAAGDLGVNTTIDGSVLDQVAEGDNVKGASSSVTTKLNRVEQVHGKDLVANVRNSVWRDTVGPLRRYRLLAIEEPLAVGILLSTEERGDSRNIGNVVRARWHELVQERGGSEEEEGERSEVEVWVLDLGLVVTLLAVKSEVLEVVKTAGSLGHHVKESGVHAEVVTVVGKVVVAGERSVSLELVVAVKTGLRSSQSWAERCATGSITSDRELLGDEVSVGEGQTQKGEENGQVVSDVVDVLLSVDQLVEGHDTIVGKELVVGGGVQARAWSTDVLGVVWCLEGVGSVVGVWHKEASLSVTGLAVLGIVVC